MKHQIRPATTSLLMAACICQLVPAEEGPRGYTPDAKVGQPTRIDWVFTLANQSPAEPPADWVQGYDSIQQSYERLVPPSYRPGRAHSLILFISPSNRATGLNQWKDLCNREGVLFASPHNAGNRCPIEQRVHIVLDVLDDMRRQYNIDPDRTYIGGFSGGGRIACAIAFALPEYFGGVIPVCAGGELRSESWLRHRVIDRLSVAHLTGDTDFNRGEVERFRSPLLKGVGVRSRTWIAPGVGHAIPSGKTLAEVLAWLEEARRQRAQLAGDYPASRVADSKSTPTRSQQAEDLLSEAKLRLQKKAMQFAGLMQLKGIMTRWPDLPQANEAKRLLLAIEQGDDRSWEEEDIAEQRRFIIARARGLDAYASGPLPNQYKAQRVGMARAALQLWESVLQDGQDAAATAEARQRIPELKRLIGGD